MYILKDEKVYWVYFQRWEIHE